MSRIFAHRIIYEGKVYRNHIAELTPDGHLLLTPFTNETHSTVFISGTVRLIPHSGKLCYERLTEYQQEDTI